MNRRGRTGFIVSFLAPACLIYATLVIWPLLQAFVFSAYRWRGVSTKRHFVGVGNFTKLIHDDVFWTAVRNNLTMLVVAGLAILALSLSIAHALQASGKMGKSLRAVVLFPQMISLVVVAVLWMFLYNPQFGLVNSGLKAVGLGGITRAWLGDRTTAFGSVGVAFVWYAAGFYTMLFAAALRSVPDEVKEAASLDGAIGWRRFWQVTWPMLWSVKRIAVVHLTITVVNVFALVYLMTVGGPDRATEVLLTYLYENAFKDYQFGYATTVAVANFVLVMLLSAGILVAFRRDPTEART